MAIRCVTSLLRRNMEDHQIASWKFYRSYRWITVPIYHHLSQGFESRLYWRRLTWLSGPLEMFSYSEKLNWFVNVDKPTFFYLIIPGSRLPKVDKKTDKLSRFVRNDKTIFLGLISTGIFKAQHSILSQTKWLRKNYLSTDKRTTNTFNDESNVPSNTKQAWRI